MEVDDVVQHVILGRRWDHGLGSVRGQVVWESLLLRSCPADTFAVFLCNGENAGDED